MTQTDQKLQEMEQELISIYNQASSDLLNKYNNYMMNVVQVKGAKLWDDYMEASKAGDLIASMEAMDKYKDYMQKATASAPYKKMMDQISTDMSNINKTALAYVNDQLPEIYSINYNDTGTGLVKGYSFELVDASTVKNLVTHGDTSLLPLKELNVSKDKAWNIKSMNSQVLQGILQGESIDKISNRLMNVTDMNKKAAIRNARTMTTSAENKGRQDSYMRAQSDGVNMKKVWLSTSDDRTRESHAELNGEEVDPDEKFSNGLLYPADPSGDPCEVYNCRCTLKTKILGFKPSSELKQVEEIEQEVEEAIENPTPLVNKDDWQGHSMTATFYEIKDENPELGKEFWSELSSGDAKPSAVWKEYLAGTLDSDKSQKIDEILSQYNGTGSPIKPTKSKDNENIIDTMQGVPNDLQDDLNKAQEHADELKDKLDSFDTSEEWSGIWKYDNATLENYENLKDSIDSKKDYYETAIEEYESEDSLEDWEKVKLEQLKENYGKLMDYDQKGQEYLDAKNEYKDALKQVKDLTPKPEMSGSFDSDLYTDETKNSVIKYTNRDDADKHHREYLDQIWEDLDDAEKYAVWEYTHNSNPMNKPLSGYTDTWDRRDFIGMENTEWGREDRWRSIPSVFSEYGKNGNVDYHSTITNLTTAIDKSILPEGTYLVRGSGKDGFAGLIEGSLFSYDEAESLIDGKISDMRDALVGQTFYNHAFTSTGIATGTGFSGQVAYEIYAPAGTHAIYAEPQSYYGYTISGAELYKTGQDYYDVGHEAEIIVQRGTGYRITDIKKDGSTLVVKMEVVDQPDYFKHGDENTYDAGKTRHKK